ncbi:hypothetical protein JYG34_03265 [Pseudomonas entomophila]|uniref:hypothetical protein n=1 Tax=Pseudomonas entomophila TaxID=312306 RepID=UPI001BD16F30|nr:hypothetical protein [Pseudomonas entomophila]QVM92064.1 hypothetical protein JYG34_03265 [Pseudomonas entomophila]
MSISSSLTPNASSEEETKSHPLLNGHSFPVDSIGPEDQNETAWKCNQRNTHYNYREGEDGSRYVEIKAGADIWQDIKLSVNANPFSEGRPEYKLGCLYNSDDLSGCSLVVFLIEDGGGEGKNIFDESLGASAEKVTWHRLDAKRIPVPEETKELRVKFKTPTGENGSILLKEAVMELLLPAFDD